MDVYRWKDRGKVGHRGDVVGTRGVVGLLLHDFVGLWSIVWVAIGEVEYCQLVPVGWLRVERCRFVMNSAG